MKIYRIGLFIVILIMNTSLYSQSIYYGYPESGSKINKGDVIIANLPSNTDGRFNSSSQLSNLIYLIKNNPDVHHNISINVFYGSEGLSMEYSKKLKDDLIGILKTKSNLLNYTISNKGSSMPIFMDSRSNLFKKINTRLEILVE
jgi:hypothetical protein